MKKIVNTKQRFFLMTVICMALFSSSCKKGLETEPYSYFTSANFFADQNEAYLATLGVYEIMSSQTTYGLNIPFIFDNDTDLSQADGVDLSTDFRVIAHYNGVPETPSFYATWSALYSGIDRTNNVIEKIPQMTLFSTGTAAQKADLNRMLGEAKFLRGFYYFELVRLWGDVPFKLKPSVTGDNFKLPRTDRYEIYAQIIKDMTEAADVLPITLPTDERVNKWAAKAMLAKVELFAGGYSLRQNEQMERPADYKNYYTLAKKQIDDIMGQNVYRLNADYAQVFKNQCRWILEPTENIFQVAFYNQGATAAGGNALGFIYGSPVTAAGTYNAVSVSRELALRSFYDSYLANDLRRDFAIGTYQINALGVHTPLAVNTTSDQRWVAAKWSREYQTNDPLERQSTHINTVIMRYSDLLLMRAEIENELNGGPNILAYDAINQVRRRGFGKPVATADATVDLRSNMSQAEFFTAIKNERAWELCFEGQRRSDLIRWNILGPTLVETNAKVKVYRPTFTYVASVNFVPNKHELYPIPLNERDVNPNVGQNPKY